jgi:hypothetical protein
MVERKNGAGRRPRGATTTWVARIGAPHRAQAIPEDAVGGASQATVEIAEQHQGSTGREPPTVEESANLVSAFRPRDPEVRRKNVNRSVERLDPVERRATRLGRSPRMPGQRFLTKPRRRSPRQKSVAVAVVLAAEAPGEARDPLEPVREHAELVSRLAGLTALDLLKRDDIDVGRVDYVGDTLG